LRTKMKGLKRNLYTCKCNLGKNMHEWFFRRRSKLHESKGRVQFEVFEKLTSVCFSHRYLIWFLQIARETIPLLRKSTKSTLIENLLKTPVIFVTCKCLGFLYYFLQEMAVSYNQWNLHCISPLYFEKKCTVLSQSETKHFFMYIIRIHRVQI
jgi:hypothetical protein